MVLSAVPQPSSRPGSRMSRQQQQQSYRTPLKLNDNVVEVKSKVSRGWGSDGDESGHVSGNQMIVATGSGSPT